MRRVVQHRLTRPLEDARRVVIHLNFFHDAADALDKVLMHWVFETIVVPVGFTLKFNDECMSGATLPESAR